MKKEKTLVQLTPIYMVRPIAKAKPGRYFAFKTKTHHPRVSKIRVIVIRTQKTSYEVLGAKYYLEDRVKQSFEYVSNDPLNSALSEELKKEFRKYFNMQIVIPLS